LPDTFCRQLITGKGGGGIKRGVAVVGRGEWVAQGNAYRAYHA